MASTSARKPAPEIKNWWPRKKKRKNEIQMYPRKLDESWIKEFVGDKRIYVNKPSAWESRPKVGMDKIRAKSDMGKYFVDFASSSTVHGFNHLTAPHRHPLERVLAVIFVFGALVALILLSLNFWDRYQNDAVISVIDNDYRKFSITEPSLLICPVLKYDREKFPTVFHRHGIDDTKEARAFFTFLATAKYIDFVNTPMYDAVPSEKWLTVLWDLKRDVITDSPLQESRTWVVTETGFCLHFFSYVADYSSYEYWMENNWTRVPVPEELPSYTYEHRDHVQTLNILTDAVIMSNVYPTEIPDTEKPGIFVGQSHYMTIEIHPQEIKTASNVKDLSITQRKCKRPDEGALKLWPVYSQFMCIQECKYELMRKVCGCYPHFTRPMPGIPICNAKQLRCIGKHSQEFMAVYITAGKACNCLHNCDTATYEEVVINDAELKDGSPTDAFLNYHVDFPLQLIRRELLFGLTDFLTSVGGAAGLFLGASVISFIELIYYATLRLFWYKVEIRKKKKLKMKKIVVKENNSAIKY